MHKTLGKILQSHAMPLTQKVKLSATGVPVYSCTCHCYAAASLGSLHGATNHQPMILWRDTINSLEALFDPMKCRARLMWTT